MKSWIKKGSILVAIVVTSFVEVASNQQPLSQRIMEKDETPDFQKHIVPMLGKLGCSSAKCHGSFQGQGDLRLSLFGFNFLSDHKELTGDAYGEEGSRVNLKKPKESLLLRKPTKLVRHKGGEVIKQGSWEYKVLLRWISNGAPGIPANKSDIENTLKNDKDNEGNSFFKTTIKPILEDNCYECHGFNKKKGGLQLKTISQALEGGDTGPVIVPGDSEESLLIKAVRHLDPDFQMPPKRKLDQADIDHLERWINMGAPWPEHSEDIPIFTGKTLKTLHYHPSEIVFSDSIHSHSIQIIAEWEDGETEDVTCISRFKSNDDSIAQVDSNGLVNVISKGDTHIVAFYDNGVVAIPVISPFRKPNLDLEGEGENPIDSFINSKLSKLGLTPSSLCSDEEFLRRVSIDMTGSLPTPQEVIDFIDNPKPDKRNIKIAQLLDSPPYAAWWANKICDFTGCNPASIRSNLEVAQEKGYVKATEWYDWVYQGVINNESYDNLVEGIMLAPTRFQRNHRSTQNLRDGGMPHFWTRQSLEKPQDTAMSVAHSFLGIQLQCAECHKHPFDRWTQNDFVEFTKFFDRNHQPADSGTNTFQLLRSGSVELTEDTDPRKPILDWMRDPENPWFARAFVNRVWAGYFHKGIVEPPDQFTPANPPSHPDLLNWLTSNFIEKDFDMKWLHMQITSSKVYQRSWKPNKTNSKDSRNFSRFIPRRIPAEVVYDAMKQATASSSKLIDVRNNLKRRASGHLSMRMAGTHAMRVFGKPDRSINCDCERVNEPTLLQAIFLQNDPLVRMRVYDSEWVIDLEDSIADGKPIDRLEIINEVWLRTLGRVPAQHEKQSAQRHLESVDSIPEGVMDLIWALFNTKEFLLNH